MTDSPFDIADIFKPLPVEVPRTLYLGFSAGQWRTVPPSQALSWLQDNRGVPHRLWRVQVANATELRAVAPEPYLEDITPHEEDPTP